MTMPQHRYLASRTTKITHIGPKRIRQVILAARLVGIAFAASWMLAVLLPLSPSFYLQAPGNESASIISSPVVRSIKGDRLTTEKAGQRREVETIGTKYAPVSNGTRKIPVGCDAAFSQIVKFGNFTARCVT
jgi:hypothetical protein